jgi:uncharacterized protein (DUF3084 family)
LEHAAKSRELAENELDKHKKVLTLFQQELEMSRSQNFELDSRLQMMSQQHMSLARVDQDSKIKIEELTTALRQQDMLLRTRDEEVNKLREDN